MYCPSCGSKNDDAARFCSNCGKPLVSTEPAQPSPAAPTPAPVAAVEPGRGATILTLGILSIVLLGPILGIPAWVMGSRDGKKIRAGLIEAKQRGMTQAGMVLGIVGTFLSVLGIVAIIAIVGVVATTIFTVRTVSQGNQQQGLAAVSPAYEAKAAPLAFYDDIEQIRGQTADDPPAIFLISVSLGYDPKDKEVSTEIGNRKREIQDLILRDIRHKTAADLAPGMYDSIQADILNQVLMSTGKVKNVTFRQFVVQK
jgi:flagellar basal body-associated protein FliL